MRHKITLFQQLNWEVLLYSRKLSCSLELNWQNSTRFRYKVALNRMSLSLTACSFCEGQTLCRSRTWVTYQHVMYCRCFIVFKLTSLFKKNEYLLNLRAFHHLICAYNSFIHFPQLSLVTIYAIRSYPTEINVNSLLIFFEPHWDFHSVLWSSSSGHIGICHNKSFLNNANISLWPFAFIHSLF